MNAETKRLLGELWKSLIELMAFGMFLFNAFWQEDLVGTVAWAVLVLGFNIDRAARQVVEAIKTGNQLAYLDRLAGRAYRRR